MSGDEAMMGWRARGRKSPRRTNERGDAASGKSSREKRTSKNDKGEKTARGIERKPYLKGTKEKEPGDKSHLEE